MRALIFGITGQLGSYIAELLLDKGYDVYGCVRRVSSGVPWRISHLLMSEKSEKLHLVGADVTDYLSVNDILLKTKPAEVYICSGLSNPVVSWTQPEVVMSVNGLGVLRVLEAVRLFSPRTRVFHASSAEIFAKTSNSPQSIASPTEPYSPSGCAKLYAHSMVKLFREVYGVYAVNGVFFSIESPRKSEEFLTRRITRGIGRIKAGSVQRVEVGNVDLTRDFVHARDCAVASWLMLQQKNPQDYVIGSGQGHTYKEFIELAFKLADLNWIDHVVVSDKLFTDVEHTELVADASKISQELGWQPSMGFEAIIQDMVESDIRLADFEIKNKMF